MAQGMRSRLIRMPKQEHEIHLINNPLEQLQLSDSFDSSSINRQRTTDYDYQAPLTANSLRPNSKWLIVRRNLHRIRYMGCSDTGNPGKLPDFYLGLQMVRELRRAQEEIKNVDKQEDFHVIKLFELDFGQAKTKKFDISHIKPDDALIYDRLGDEPLALQNLLYYFSKQDVQQGTVFWDFLREVNQVLNLQRKRTVLVQRLRRIALTLAIIFYILIGVMFFLMIVSFISTATRMNDPEVRWTNDVIEETLLRTV